MRREKVRIFESQWQRLAASVILHALIDAVDQPLNTSTNTYYERLRRRNREQAREWIFSNDPHPGGLVWWCTLTPILEAEQLREKLAEFDQGRDSIAEYVHRLGWARNLWGRHHRTEPD